MTGKRKWRGLRKNYEERRLWGKTVTGESREAETEGRRWRGWNWEQKVVLRKMRGDKAMREIGWRENVWWERNQSWKPRGEVNIRDSKGWRKPRTGWRKVGKVRRSLTQRSSARGQVAAVVGNPRKLYPELLQPETVVSRRFVRALLPVIRRMPSGSRFLDPPPKRALAL